MKLAWKGEVPKVDALKAMAQHRESERLAQKHGYWYKDRGCAVGCLLHTFAPGFEGVHKYYQHLFGIPTSLAYLEDAIFEGMPTSQAMTWPERFLETIPEGADLSKVADRFILWVLAGENSPMAQYANSDFVTPVAQMYREVIKGKTFTAEEWIVANAHAREEGGIRYSAPRVSAARAVLAAASLLWYSSIGAAQTLNHAACVLAQDREDRGEAYSTAADRLVELIEQTDPAKEGWEEGLNPYKEDQPAVFTPNEYDAANKE